MLILKYQNYLYSDLAEESTPEDVPMENSSLPPRRWMRTSMTLRIQQKLVSQPRKQTVQ
jgi:hypothetical protein